MANPLEEIASALDTLALPPLIRRSEIKAQYRLLAQKHHPDRGGDPQKMEAINHAYELLIAYIENFRYTFDEEEIYRQFPGADYAQRFKP
jgi:DnaJ-class molecular chaperone